MSFTRQHLLLTSHLNEARDAKDNRTRVGEAVNLEQIEVGWKVGETTTWIKHDVILAG